MGVMLNLPGVEILGFDPDEYVLHARSFLCVGTICRCKYI
jgi:hypothetical protein